MRSVTLDTNIYISALEFGGKPMAVLQAGFDGDIDIAVSQQIIDETLRVLRDKFRWSDADLQDAKAAILAAAHVVTQTETLDVVRTDPDDNRILECAVAAGSAVIVTGDSDLLRLGSYGGIEIQRPADFLAGERGRDLTAGTSGTS